MFPKAALAALTVLGFAYSSSAHADVVRGRVVRAEGRVNASCPLIGLRRQDGSISHFRITSSGGSEAILSVALSALLARAEVELQYSPVPNACGSEPAVEIIAILAP